MIMFRFLTVDIHNSLLAEYIMIAADPFYPNFRIMKPKHLSN